jgi:hypothetical protein
MSGWMRRTSQHLEEWFPERVVEEAKKVKTSAAAEASNEANEGVNDEVRGSNAASLIVVTIVVN